MDTYDKKLLDLVRMTLPNLIAEEICEVQPFSKDLLKKLRQASIDEKELIEQGFKPVSEDTRLMWIKEE